VGRIRFQGVLLYDASRIEEIAKLPDSELIEGQRSIILDPDAPEVIAAARKNGVHDSVIESAQKSPVYKFVKTWKMALPPHIEFRTLPMLFYVPPMSPVMGMRKANGTINHVSEDLFHDIESARAPLAYLGRLLGAGSDEHLRYALRKQKAVRTYRRTKTVGDVTEEQALRMLEEADCSPEEASDIYRLTSLSTFDQRFVIPPMHREEAIQMLENDTLAHKNAVGFGFITPPKRGL
jgi:nitrate reductase beta subunit